MYFTVTEDTVTIKGVMTGRGNTEHPTDRSSHPSVRPNLQNKLISAGSLKTLPWGHLESSLPHWGRGQYWYLILINFTQICWSSLQWGTWVLI